MIRSLFKTWDQFWFSPVPLVNLAIFRIIFLTTLFFMYLPRQFSVDLFFSDSGILPKKSAIEIMPEFFRPAFVLSFWPDAWLSVVHVIFLFGILLLLFGFGARWFQLVVGLIVVYLNQAFLQRNASILFGADQIGGIFLFFLIWTRHSEVLSFQSWRKGKFWPWGRLEGHLSGYISQGLLTPIFYRMVQVQLCVIYAYTGFEKLKGSTWWEGTALWSVFANPQFVIIDMTWMKHFPNLIGILSFSTILFEIYFPVLVWFKKTKVWALLAGFLFHLGIGLVMALYGFVFVMLSPYVLFMPQESVVAWLNKIKQN